MPLSQLPPGFALVPSTRDAYWHALEALPPVLHSYGWFLAGEPVSHRACTVTGTVLPTWDLHIEHEGRGVFFRGSEPVTLHEYHALRDDPAAYLEAIERGRASA